MGAEKTIERLTKGSIRNDIDDRDVKIVALDTDLYFRLLDMTDLKGDEPAYVKESAISDVIRRLL